MSLSSLGLQLTGLAFVLLKCAAFAPSGAQIVLNCMQKRTYSATLNRVTSFVFKYFLASFPLFFIFCISLACRLTGTVPIGPPDAWCGSHQRQNVHITDHPYRLSGLDGVVKQETDRVPKLFGSAIIQARPTRTNLLGVVHLPDCRHARDHQAVVPR